MPLHARARRVVSRLAALSLPWEDLPIGVALPLKYAVYVTTHFPDAALCPNECRLVNRADLLPEHDVPPCALPLIDKDSLDASRDNDDGFTDVVLASQPLFPKDQRLKEVCRLLRSNKPMLLKVQREAHHSDADVLSLQQARLLLLCKRSMSLSVARGMVTLGSLTAQQSSASPYTARLSIPQLPLTARVSGTNAKTVLDISGYKEITHWPQFHNGVATALRLSPHDRVTVQWVLSHQPKPNADESDEAVRLYEEACAGHAGFLFGLGLQGQLQCQSPTTTYKYLSLGDELTSVGFLLGTAASTLHHPKDMNIERAVSKMLSMHIPSLWPPSFAHLHVPASAQTAAIMGLGLLYQSTGNRLMTGIPPHGNDPRPVLTSAGATSGTTATPSTEAVHIEPTRAWVINKQLPPPLRPTGLLHWAAIDDGGDPATIQEAYANVIAGACFSIGLKFAGTHHPDAKRVLMSFLDEFQLWRAKLGRTADVSRVTLERVLGTIAQSLALVMAGTGDLECMRLLRSLLLRQKVDAHGDITYGNHMAMSSALGLLFLGGGRCSVRTPTLLPARSMLRRLETAANDHFPIVVDWSTTDDSRAGLLEQQGVLRIKRKLGADAPRATFFASFSKLFATVLTQASDAMWIAFCARLYEECKRENKPDCVAVYLNAKRCEVDVLEHRITHTLLVANLQLVQLHMELDAHMFQARDDASAEPHDVGRLAQLVNEDFTLGYSNALLAFFEQLDISIETNEAPTSLLHAAYRRYLGSPLLAQLE
ncbi:hypothetical protein SPRG_22263 [Saprolegnia parasitica CBS 223.65]|uniref:Uncharacterized protein n=1 Tax=Saprolegnia parasitica (strain CBS 223.65) TaxID=695850 RepID=A0A067C097_SAPPC|nr:hypothetical protein SPRG_22263 [Saprolegnia parasitica CBS 223.65]KDO23963.1 hypothetical protein SPRG_22263 [Saprolegnia parasitica CBS 223.65]|eukprot:XP_012205344.1 hypothetical protein SPRG_22263 [Saprolegnia parasitica CBS 223.65]